jgi:hypothetical protein
VVIIRQKLVFPTDARITEGLTLTRDQMTASTDIFRPRLFVYLVSPFHVHQQPDSNLLFEQGGKGMGEASSPS